MNLPESWELASFEDVFKKISITNKKVKKGDYLDEGETPVIDQGEEFIGGYTNNIECVIELNSPIIVFGDHTKVIKYVDFNFAPGADGVKILNPKYDLNTKLLSYYLRYYQLPNKGYSRHYKYLKKIKVPIPPKNEQGRIVDKIEELFSKIDDGIKSLEKVKKRLEHYRQSVLQAVVEGKLTREWREENRDSLESADQLLERILEERQERWEEEYRKKYEDKGKDLPKNWKSRYSEPESPDTSDLPEIPDEWLWITLPQAGEIGRGRSRHRPRNDPKLFGGEYPFIQTGEVRAADKYIKKYEQTYNEEGLKQSKLWSKGTLCITIAANIADTGILTFDCCFPDSIVGFTPHSKEVLVEYVEYFFRTAKKDLERFAPATAQKNINLTILSEVSLPLPPLKEQKKIVDILESKISTAKVIEDQIEKELKRASNTKQSILKRAFSGNLVPQDPDDEPASELLRRIKDENNETEEQVEMNL